MNEEMSVLNYNSKKVKPAMGNNPRILYEHQIEAMKRLDEINKRSEFRSLLVLPTGGGKTLTAVYWLLKNAVDKNKKVLWIAHRHLLLEQAAETFVNNAYVGNLMINNTEFNLRIISGLHDKPVHIKKDDNIIIASKDSLVHGAQYLKDWLENEDIYLIIDEAHHSVAKSYKKIIEYVSDNTNSMKLLGLTATPFRTSEEEKGALKTIFTDDIVFKTDLDALIKKEILATPDCKEFDTDILVAKELGVNDLKSIENFDTIPKKIATEIAVNSKRNHFIVQKYLENYQKYGPTIVFAINQSQAMALNTLFNDMGKQYGIKSDFIISGVKDIVTGVTISTKDNNEKIEKYRNGDIQVLINVNILTEGTDLPKTHTVFLTRPTISTVLMTQMIGRALRGVRAGGTREAYIVSFIDNWNGKIAWVNPKTLTDGNYKENETEAEKVKHNIRLISIAKIEEFARLANDNVDTIDIERIPVIERIPLGMYTFSFIDNNEDESMEHYHQILIYNNSKTIYEEIINVLPDLLDEYHIDDENIPNDVLEEVVENCGENYFDEFMIPAYNPYDIECLIKFYAQKGVKPYFVTFDELNRKQLNVSIIAKNIYEQDMRTSEKKTYLNDIWNEEGSILPIYYNHFLFFKKIVASEIDKLEGDIIETSMKPECEAEIRNAKLLPLQELISKYPEYGMELRERVFNEGKDKDGFYVCKRCGNKFKTRVNIQIDHIIPLSKGGTTEYDNLQLLCRRCNTKKSDKV